MDGSGGSPEAGRRDYVEALSRLFERIGGWSFDHRWIVLAACAALLVASALLATRTRFDNSFEVFFDTRDPAYVAYNQFRDDFGSDEISYILYSVPGSPHGAFDLGAMRKIARLTEALEHEVPFVKQVTSLTNVEHIEGVPDGIEVYDLLEEFPGSQEEMLAVRAKALGEPMYVGGLVSADAQYAAVVVEMELSSVDPLEDLRLDPEGGDGLGNLYPQVVYHAIEGILARPEYEGIAFHHVGDVPLNAIYNEIVASESGWMGAATFGLIGLLLFFFFRRPIGVIGPLAVVALSVLVSVGWIGLFGWKLDMMFIMLPTLLIAVGVADAVHIITEFRAYHADLGDRREAVRRTLYLVGTPCLLTSLTTAAGFASMSIAPIKAIAHLAVYSAVGVLAAFVLSVTLLLVFLSFGRRRLTREATKSEKIHAKGGRMIHAGLSAVARFDIRHRRPIMAVFAVIFVVSAVGISKLEVDSNFLDEFGEDEPIRIATDRVDNIMGGTASFVYLFDTGAPDGIKDPQVLREIARLQLAADEYGGLVRKTYSLSDVVKELNKAFHGEDPAYDVLPEMRDLVAQYLLVYEMSGGDEAQDYVSSDFSRSRLEIRSKLVESSQLRELSEAMDAYLEAEPPTASKVAATGMGELWLVMMEYITRSQIRGFLLAFTVIGLMLCILFRSLKTGLIAMVPNLSPAILTLGVMGWADVPLDYVRLMIASVAIGISVDDTIHHVTRFHLEFKRCGRYERALHASMNDVGRALFITSVVLVAGFLVMQGSRLDSIGSFGALLATTITVALVADFLLMPALVLTLRPFGPERADAGPAEVVAPAAR